ncbi:MAG: putative branched-subunit amino acid permease [Parasphingorhabdus sp.]|jgi:predicted branched-subunit amino acid permease
MQYTGFWPVVRKALIDSISLPAFILLTTMIGFGSLARSAGFSADMAWVATVAIWGLPGQLAMLDLTASGQNFVTIIVACSLANARFLPMVVSFLPWINTGKFGLGRATLAAQMLSINSWAICLRQFPLIDKPWRRVYYSTFASSIILAAIVGTLIGYHGAGALPVWVVLGFIFTSPLFFALVLSSAKGASARWALLFGCILIPITTRWLPSVDLLVTGVVGGTAAFLVGRKRLIK